MKNKNMPNLKPMAVESMPQDSFSHDHSSIPKKHAQWEVSGDNNYVAQNSSIKSLPRGTYNLKYKNDLLTFERIELYNDEILLFKSGIASDIFSEIKLFWSSKEKFKELGFLHKRGILLYGPAGTGKSSIVSQVIKNVINSNGVVIDCRDPYFLNMGITQLRDIEPYRPIVCIFEDIDSIISRYGDSEVLAFLDGSEQHDNVLSIATTNYPEKLDKRIISRPRRFDSIYAIPFPEDKVKREYLKNKLPKDEDVDTWMEKTKELSFASIADAVISVVCMGNKLDDVIAKLNKIKKETPSSDEFNEYSSVGFGNKE